MDILLVLLILTAAIVLFASEWIRMDLVSMLILLSLTLTGLVTPEQAFAGFSNPAVITVAAMFVISAAISNTGIGNRLGEKLALFAGGSEIRLIVAIMATVAVMSAFINNIGATAIMLPLVISLARKTRIPPSKLLMPLAFGSLVGGICTLIGTPPNILINSLLQTYSNERLEMFSFSPIGIPIVLLTIAYMAFIGRPLLPKRKAGSLTEAYQVKEYITEVEIPIGSPLAGKTISASHLEEDLNLRVRALLRNKVKIPQPRRNHKLREGDILFLEGDPHGILKARKTKGLLVVPERDNPSWDEKEDELVVVEASLTPTTEMAGKTLSEVRFRDIHGLTVLAIWRHGAPVVKKVDHVVLQFGDVLLLQGPERNVSHLGKAHGFLLLGGVPMVSYQPEKVPVALGTLFGIVILAATGLLPIMISATLGAVVLVLSRCLTAKEAYESIDWSIILLIAGTLPLGVAMENSGAAKLLADFLVKVLGGFGPWAALSALFLVTFLLTSIMSNAATVVLHAPIAFNAAIDFGVDPKPFFMAVAIAASASFMTPISHQSNALVMGPGGYRFADFMRVGTPLNLIIWLAATLLIPLIFPFHS